MNDRRSQGISLLLLSIALSLFLMFYSLAAEVDFTACFDNLDGFSHHSRVSEMSFFELASATGRHFSPGALVIAIPGLLPLIPFSIAWLLSKEQVTRTFWFVSALVAFAGFVGCIFTTGFFHDCDRGGVSLGIVALPVLYAVLSLAAIPVLLVLRFLTLLFVVRA